VGFFIEIEIEILKYIRIKDWADDDKPREKLLNKGKESLSNAELIGILIRMGAKNTSAIDIAKNILSEVKNDLNVLAKFSVEELMKFRGIGEAKAIAIVSALELGRRRSKYKSADKEIITGSRDTYLAISPLLKDKKHEEFWILLLNRKNEIIKKKLVSTGGVSGTLVDPKIVFKTALDNLASSIVMVHNHPSGNLKPSKADINLTRKLIASGKMIEIPVLDHLIFSDNGYFSFADEGYLE